METELLCWPSTDNVHAFVCIRFIYEKMNLFILIALLLSASIVQGASSPRQEVTSHLRIDFVCGTARVIGSAGVDYLSLSESTNNAVTSLVEFELVQSSSAGNRAVNGSVLNGKFVLEDYVGDSCGAVNPSTVKVGISFNGGEEAELISEYFFSVFVTGKTSGTQEAFAGFAPGMEAIQDDDSFTDGMLTVSVNGKSFENIGVSNICHSEPLRLRYSVVSSVSTSSDDAPSIFIPATTLYPFQPSETYAPAPGTGISFLLPKMLILYFCFALVAFFL